MSDGAVKNFWKNKISKPLMAQLTQGVSPHHLALSCAFGITLGIFPILGSTTILCFLVGSLLKLNQPSIQVVNYLVYPLQLILFPVFIKTGEKIFNAVPITFDPLKLSHEFVEAPLVFLSKYGAAGCYGIVVWLLVAPFLMGLVYFPLVRLFKKVESVRGHSCLS